MQAVAQLSNLSNLNLAYSGSYCLCYTVYALVTSLCVSHQFVLDCMSGPTHDTLSYMGYSPVKSGASPMLTDSVRSAPVL